MSTRRIMMPAIVLLSLFGSAFLLGDDKAPNAAATCYLGHLSTDKPIYRIGERVYLRGVVLGALDHAPAPANAPGIAQLEIAAPHGEHIFQQSVLVEDSVAAFAWNVPDGAAGGTYTAKMSFPQNGFPPTQRTFEVRAYRAPRLKGEIVFLRDGFGPGDTVKASLHVERAEGGLPTGAKVQANAIVDGQNVYSGNTTVDAAGNCSVAFALPKQINSPEGTLSLTVADGGVIEPIAKTIPILLKTVDLAIYPEGGDLIAGLPCRVYLEARTSAKKPADVVGQVFDAGGKPVADLKTEHEGRGRFVFTPKAGESYSIRLSQPSGIATAYPLPAIKPTGAVLNSATDVTSAGAAVKLNLTATDAGKYTVTLSKRQTEIASVTTSLSARVSESLVLTPPAWADGVLVATARNADGTPVAERLIFRAPSGSVHVEVSADKSSYNPADKVTVTIKTTDDAGKPLSAIVGVTATDQSILRMLERRDRAPRLREMALLEDDVRELADAEVYLDPADPRAPMAIDLLLGTQGWRRFATVDPKKFLASAGDSARRVLGDVQSVVQVYRGREFGGGGEGGLIERDGLAEDRLAQNGAIEEKAGQQAPGAPMALAARPMDLDKALKDQQQQAGQQLVDQEQLQRQSAGALRSRLAPGPVRIYAHDLRPDRSADDRSDFTETLYWCAAVKTDEKTGIATVSFSLNDSVTSFDITADAFDSHGQLGEGNTTITSTQPFYIEPKMPLAVSAGDVIHLPIAAVNGTPSAMSNVQLTVTDADSGGVIHVAPFDIPAGQRVRKLVDVNVGSMPGTVHLQIKGEAGSYSDTVTRTFEIDPFGFPTQIDSGGILSANSKATHTVIIPDSLAPGSMKATAMLYPTPLANLTEALQGLLQEPNGCFEQTTSTNYPLVMADQYFTTHTGVDPTLIARSNDLMDKGYARLVSFECQNKGYEWFGQDPGHECLTAYGLLEFTDMSAVHSVDPKMLADTRAWLLARRDGKGGYTHERRSMHTWITDPGCANGYCTWALLECGQTGLQKEVKWLADNAKTNPNSYVKALAANALFLAGDKADAKLFMDELAHRQDKDGHVLGATTTVVGSGGDSLEIETTSLATLAWLRDPAYAANVESGIRYLADSCKAGRYGSTQATVLALRAIVTYDKARAHPTAAGKIQLFVDDKNIGDALAFDAKTTGTIKLPDFTKEMTPGKHTVELRMTDGSDLPYAVSIGFNSVTPTPSPDCKLAMTTALQSSDVAEGAATELRVTVRNLSNDTQPSPLAIVGIPGGLEVRHDQLKELVKADVIASYEVHGRDLVLYWRDIQPKQTITIPVSLTAAVPGTYTAAASRAYLYYTDEVKQWIPGVKVTVR
jgi:uncharacterized protein YfaS (alpha-2-macroglobulin family)